MTLDFAILDDGGPITQASLHPAVHAELIKMAQHSGCELVTRMSDYYREVHYSVDEIRTLNEELRSIMQNVSESDTENPLLFEHIAHMITITAWAIESGREIYALPD